ncbi:hypothetical protein D3C78_1196380 [compost metagenome]
MGRRRVGVQRHRHALVDQLPGGQARALQPRTGFVGVDTLDQPLQVRRADNPERRAEAASGEGAGIAMGENLLRSGMLLADQLDAELGHGQVGLAIALVDGDGFGLHHCQHIVTVLEALQAVTHAIERPEQIDCRRPRFGQHLEIRLERGTPVAVLAQTSTQAKHHAISRCDTDGRCTAHHHLANRLGHPGRAFVGQPGLFQRQQTLIQQPECPVAPINGRYPLGRQQPLTHGTPHHSNSLRTVPPRRSIRLWRRENRGV